MNRRSLILGGVAIAALSLSASVIGTSTTLKDAIALAQSNDFAAAGHVVQLWAGQWGTSNQIELAKLYAAGKGIRQDNREAVAWYRRAAEHGNAEAQNKLGIAYQNGIGVSLDYATAMEWYRKAADQGDAAGMLSVAWLYKKGLGCPKSESEAFTWFRKAGDQGDVLGQLMAGLAYVQGAGTQLDNAEAVNWFRKSAEQGNAKAEFMLSVLYTSGQGVPQDFVQARKWMEKAAEQGDPEAQFNVGAMYFNGAGVKQDAKKANEFFLKAAAQGNANAQETLGQIYNVGQYGPDEIHQNKVVAYALFNLAAAQGHTQATTEKAALADILTPDQIAAGQTLASNWKLGDPLPFGTSLEDVAPQYLYHGNVPSEVMKATSVWFSRDFAASGTNYRTVFLVTKGEECHACQAHVGAVTFRFKNGVPDEWEWPQPNFVEMGSYGHVAALKDPNASFDSATRVDVEMLPLGSDKMAVMVNETDGGQGEIDTWKNVFVFDQKGWHGAGTIQTSSNRVEDCRKAAVGAVQSPDQDPLCYSWSGTVQLDNSGKKDWPDFILKARGTEVEYGTGPSKLVSVSEVRYQYDGGKYVPLTGKN